MDIAQYLVLPKEALAAETQLLSAILRSITTPLLAVDAESRILTCNPAALSFFKIVSTVESIMGRRLQEVIQEPPELFELAKEAVEGGASLSRELPVSGLRGYRVARFLVSPIFVGNGVCGGASIAVFDVTALKRLAVRAKRLEAAHAHAELERSQEPLGPPRFVVSMDAEGVLIGSTTALEQFLEQTGLAMEAILPEGHAGHARACLQTDARSERILREVAGRRLYWSYIPLKDHGIVQAQLREPLGENAYATLQEAKDPVTGLPSRAAFLELLERSVHREQRDKKFAVAYMDMDRFKLINDSLGRDVGDAMLKELAERIRSVLRPCDAVCRYSSDEFAVLLEHMDDLDDVLAAVARIQETLEKPFHYEGYELYTSSCVGVVLGDSHYITAQELIRDADTAMYRAKGKGKAEVAVYTQEMQLTAKRRLEIEMDLKRTINSDEFQVYYQPIVRMESGHLHGFEALVRWAHPVRGMISPNDFIPLAEETGIIMHIGSFVLYEACKTLAEWRTLSSAWDELMLSVNLSVRQFRSPSLLDDIANILAWTDFPAANLKLEITESGVMEDAESSLKLMNALRAMDIRLSIDDFGTGYSSLSYLHRFPFDYLKVDQSFVRGLDSQDRTSENRKIVQTIVRLAQDMDKEIIAEGVEKREQYMLLRDMGCEFGQGYYFARPLPVAEAYALLMDDPCWLPEGAPRIAGKFCTLPMMYKGAFEDAETLRRRRRDVTFHSDDK